MLESNRVFLYVYTAVVSSATPVISQVSGVLAAVDIHARMRVRTHSRVDGWHHRRSFVA